MGLPRHLLNFRFNNQTTTQNKTNTQNNNNNKKEEIEIPKEIQEFNKFINNNRNSFMQNWRDYSK